MTPQVGLARPSRASGVFGASEAINALPGVRAALCTDVGTAAGARRWTDANVLALGIRLTGQPEHGAAPAIAIVDAFLGGAPDGSETDNISKIV